MTVSGSLGCSGQDLEVQSEGAAEKGRVQQHMLKVTGLGQLARLIELGCNVGVGSPGSASQHCAQAVDFGAPVRDRSSEHRPQAADDVTKAINVFKTDGGTGGVSKTSQQGKNEAGR